MNGHVKLILLRSLLIALTLSIICFIFSQSVLPATESSAESGRVVTFLNSICRDLGIDIVFTQGFVRTCAHLAEFAILGMMLFFTVASFTKANLLRICTTVGSFIFVALTDECIQLFADGRAFQFTDILIDVIGGIIGMLFAYLCNVLINRRNNKITE